MRIRRLIFPILLEMAFLLLLPLCLAADTGAEPASTALTGAASAGTAVPTSGDTKKTAAGKKYTMYNGVDLSAIYDFDYYVKNNKYAKTHFKNHPQKAILYFGRYGIRKGAKAKESYSKSTYKKLYKKTHPFPSADKILDRLGWNLKKAFTYAANITSYHGSDLGEYNSPYLKTSKWYYEYYRKHGRGNCYCKAATFCILASELGYKCRQIGGTVPYRSTAQAGPHSWMEIQYKGKWRVCDPSFFALTGGSHGWMFQYGQKGTYRYSTPHKMKLQ